MKCFRYVVEHMEEDQDSPDSIPLWVKLEYAMRILAGQNATIEFTSLSKQSIASLITTFTTPGPSPSGSPPLAAFSCHQEGILDLMKQSGTPLHKVCLLDPKAEQEISPKDSESFDWFLFGGILGDDPPRDRTSALRAHAFPSRHLGPVQMTTDTALGTTKLVVADKIPLVDISYIDFPTIMFNAKESVEMPFRYISVDGEPLLPQGMKELLKKDLDRAFEF